MFNRICLRQCLAAVDHTTCASKFTAARLRELMPMIAEKAEHVFPNLSFNPECCQFPAQLAIKYPFILSVAQHRENKNILLLLQAFAGLLDSRSVPSEMHLVIVGSQGPLTKQIVSQISSLSLHNNVVMANSLPDSELLWLYQHCELFLAPSSIEGFGLPLAEALRCGARVVCSDIPPFREIAGGTCHYFSLESATVLADLVRACQVTLCEDRPSPEPLDEFSSAGIGLRYVSIYLKLLQIPHDLAGSHLAPSDQVMRYDSPTQ